MMADKLTGCECVDWICVAKDSVQGKFVVKIKIVLSTGVGQVAQSV